MRSPPTSCSRTSSGIAGPGLSYSWARSSSRRASAGAFRPASAPTPTARASRIAPTAAGRTTAPGA
eukprot:3929137-Alexandrium_andersonii.AAC.1